MLQLDSLLPRQVNRKCKQCMFVSGALIEPCRKCLVQLYFDEPDTDCDSDSEKPQMKKKRKLTEEQQKRRIQNRARQMKCRAEKIAKIALKRQEEKLAAFKSRRLSREGAILGRLQTEDRNTFAKYCQNQPKHLEQHNREFDESASRGAYSRGCVRGATNCPLLKYSKPAGYFGYALEVRQGPQLGRHNQDGEWVVAYHGTPFCNIASILSSQLRPGTRQAHSSKTNVNGIAGDGTVGDGIYLSPEPSSAESYGSSNGFYCLLQCRVNPRAVRFGPGNSREFWVVPDGSQIIPYRLLFKLR